ncbi:MAG: hypothetical protein WCT08_00830 [Patescibacteria group bacterium]|jgi:hypothetical protein
MKWNKASTLVVLLFLVTVTLNFYYGSVLYSKVLGKQYQFTIGKECFKSRPDCEAKYFQGYLDKIGSLTNESRTYFSNIIIQNNQKGYTGNCPCPYDSDSAGNSCGGRSSYSKNGRISFCYDSDVPAEQIVDLKSSMIAQERKNLDDAIQKDINIYHEQYTLLIVVIIYSVIFFYFKNKKY